MSKIFNINLDVKKNNYICLGEFKIGDNLSQINGTMLQNGQAYDLTGLTLRVNYRDSQGNLYFQDETKGVSIINPTEGTFKIAVLSSVLSVEGIIKADISIFKGTQKLTSSTFSMEVVDTIYKDNAIVGADGKDLLQEIIEGEVTRQSQEIEREKNEVKRKEIVQIATDSNKSLQDTINTSITKDTTLKATIVDSIAKDNILKNTINDSVTKDTVLKSTIVKAEDKKKDLDDIIGFKVSDYVTKSDLSNQLTQNSLATLATSAPVTSLDNATDGIMQVDSIKGNTRYKKADGTYTDIWEEGVKLESTGELEGNKIEVLSRGKNLINNDISAWDSGLTLMNGYLSQTNNTALGGKSRYYRVQEGGVYSLSVRGYGSTLGTSKSVNVVFVNLLNPNKIITVVGVNFNTITTPTTLKLNNIIVPTGATHVFINTIASDSTLYFKDVQFEEGTIATPYEPYKQDKSEILLKEPLKGLPSGVVDEIVGGRVYKRIKKDILDSGKTWNITGDTKQNTMLFSAKLTDIFPRADNPNIISNNFIGDYVWSEDKEGVFSHSHALYISILKSKLTTPDVAGFKAWLQANPTEVYYELAEPIISTINPSSLKSFKDGSIVLNNAIAPTVDLSYPTSISGRISSVESTLDNTVDRTKKLEEGLFTTVAQVIDSKDKIEVLLQRIIKLELAQK